MVEDNVLFTNHLMRKWEIVVEGHGVLSFHIKRTWLKLAVISSNWFSPVVVHDK